MSGAAVVVDHVRKSFEDGRIRALEDVSLRLEPGEIVALTGPVRVAARARSST